MISSVQVAATDSLQVYQTPIDAAALSPGIQTSSYGSRTAPASASLTIRA